MGRGGGGEAASRVQDGGRPVLSRGIVRRETMVGDKIFFLTAGDKIGPGAERWFV
jgi:hypothetical protein